MLEIYVIIYNIQEEAVRINKKSVFSQIIILIIVAFVCVFLTIGLAFLFGSIDVSIFDFKNLNISNMIPVLIIGGIISLAIITIIVLFLARTILSKAGSYLKENLKKEGK